MFQINATEIYHREYTFTSSSVPIEFINETLSERLQWWTLDDSRNCACASLLFHSGKKLTLSSVSKVELYFGLTLNLNAYLNVSVYE